ncbi:hypothetical protein ES705_30893 [subsurface metagenome]
MEGTQWFKLIADNLVSCVNSLHVIEILYRSDEEKATWR